MRKFCIMGTHNYLSVRIVVLSLLVTLCAKALHCLRSKLRGRWTLQTRISEIFSKFLGRKVCCACETKCANNLADCLIGTREKYAYFGVIKNCHTRAYMIVSSAWRSYLGIAPAARSCTTCCRSPKRGSIDYLPCLYKVDPLPHTDPLSI